MQNSPGYTPSSISSESAMTAQLWPTRLVQPKMTLSIRESAPYPTPRLFCQHCLQHRLRVPHIVDLATEAATADFGVLADDSAFAFAVVINRARVFGVQAARIFQPHQFPHHGEHIHLT